MMISIASETISVAYGQGFPMKYLKDGKEIAPQACTRSFQSLRRQPYYMQYAASNRRTGALLLTVIVVWGPPGPYANEKLSRPDY